MTEIPSMADIPFRNENGQRATADQVEPPMGQPRWETPEGIQISDLYGPADIAGLRRPAWAGFTSSETGTHSIASVSRS